MRQTSTVHGIDVKSTSDDYASHHENGTQQLMDIYVNDITLSSRHDEDMIMIIISSKQEIDVIE
jgi:hypothetical protein